MTIPVSERQRLEAELAVLQSRRDGLLRVVPEETKDTADQAERALREMEAEQLEVSIRRIVRRLEAGDTRVVSNGTVQVGESVVLDFGDGQPTGYVVAPPDEFVGGGSAISPQSPLGRVLLGARAGDTVRWRTPRGEMSATVVSVGEVPAAA